MAKKNKARRNDPRAEVPLPTPRPETKPAPHPSHNGTRETLESLAIAFTLAFLVRTFVVEPFVIPTGSMSPALLGQHKDVDCPQCGERYRVNSSTQAQMRYQNDPERCVGGMCPMCRYTMGYETQLTRTEPQKSANERNYSGDRIIVNKFLYSFADPERWDVVVFKFPGNATDNYIKRLVGLPNETLRIFGGDLFVQHEGEQEFQIARKPPRTTYAMREIVHDTDREAANLVAAGWPLRWQAEEGWKQETSTNGNLVRQAYTSTNSGEHWMRYVHTTPTNDVWPLLEAGGTLPPARSHLIGDFNSYNTRIPAGMVNKQTRDAYGFNVSEMSQGIHWVGDLFVQVDVDLQSSTGQLVLELVEAGNRFRCRTDLATGTATLEIVPNGETTPTTKFTATANTQLKGNGKHDVMFANVDDALLLWIDDKLVEFSTPTTYDWDQLLGPRKQAMPQTSATDPGDLAPAGVGTVDATVAISRLRMWRDIYYLATKESMGLSKYEGIVTDYAMPPPSDVLSNPAMWDYIARRETEEFPIGTDQFFVMGDNSPQSSDARLWNQSHELANGGTSKPGGNYLERKLLIGRAISVVWPHSWYYVIPGFSDMRRIE